MSTLLTVTLWVLYYAVFVGGLYLLGVFLIGTNPKNSLVRPIAGGVVCLIALVATFYPVALFDNDDKCNSNETLISKQAGKTRIEKCVPDEELNFIFR